MMRSPLITLGSIVLTTAVISNAYFQKKQFYPSVVYITKSNPSMAVIYIQAFVLVLLMGKLVRKVFFGQLRAAEMEHLIERSWYAVTETCLAFTVFRDDFSPKFVALFTLLLFLKCFHWLAEDRVDYMERSPVISWLFHIRVVSLLILLGGLDYIFVGHAYHSTITKGASVQLVFGFEYAILFTVVMNILVKYLLHTIDLQRENPWENKAVYLLYTELLMGFFKVVLYLTFMTIMIKIHTFPLFAIRPMYLSMRAFKKAVNDVIMSRRAIRNMNTLYPDATAEDLAAADNVCIICREEMIGTGGSKKLPCNHIFHASCLRSWFQRQQTCPTCRMDVLRGSTQGVPRQQGQQQQQGIPGQQPGQPGHPQPGIQPQAMPQWPGMVQGPFPIPFAFVQAQQQQQQQQQQPTAPPGAPQDGAAGPSAPAAGATAPPSSAGGAPRAHQQPFLPPFPLLPFCFFPPPPVLPAGLDPGLSLEELRAMEGQERENVEARIQVLRNIQTLLDAAVLQMQQYTSLVSTLRTTETSENSQSRSTSAAATDLGASQQKRPSENDTTSNQPSTSQETLDDSNDPNSELRRRRIQRFSFTVGSNNNNAAGQQDDDVD